jgi:hypothetical protein
MLEKICKKHGNLNLDNIISEPNKTSKAGYTLRCRLCKREKDFRYTESHRKNICEKNKEYKKNNREKVNAWGREDRKKKPELYAAASKRVRDKLGSFRNVMEISRVRGITTERYQDMLLEQDYKCAICGLNETKKSRSGNVAQLCLDHNHTTGEVRKFLCHACNLMIGQFYESEELMTNAINYLNKHRELCQ